MKVARAVGKIRQRTHLRLPHDSARTAAFPGWAKKWGEIPMKRRITVTVVSSESTVLGYVTASARFADALPSAAPVAPQGLKSPSRRTSSFKAPAPMSRSRPPSLGNATKAYPSILDNTRHPRRARRLVWDHARRLALAVYTQRTCRVYRV